MISSSVGSTGAFLAGSGPFLPFFPFAGAFLGDV
jgi:hypothetical protein